MQEKRRHPRRRARLPLKIHRKGADPFAAESVDLSVGGLFIQAEGGVSFGEELEVELELPELGLTRLPAIVRWIRADGFGVQFGLLGARHTHALANLVSSFPGN
ncbi:MAG: PilZ domain-containing protein [Myxococcales bacterium]|nr:PilZ domain-containing protein [Polyangiaceae bacterium]MDW8248103.1 PilZ domain-containing protein [Myxococcales bacterium]